MLLLCRLTYFSLGILQCFSFSFFFPIKCPLPDKKKIFAPSELSFLFFRPSIPSQLLLTFLHIIPPNFSLTQECFAEFFFYYSLGQSFNTAQITTAAIFSCSKTLSINKTDLRKNGSMLRSKSTRRNSCIFTNTFYADKR